MEISVSFASLCQFCSAMERFIGQLSVPERGGEAYAVRVEPRGASGALLRSSGVSVTAFWHTGSLAPLTVLSVATAGAGPLAVLRPLGDGDGDASLPDGDTANDATAASAFAALHAECLAANKTAVAAPHAPGRELHLVAMPGAPCFWCAPAQRARCAARQTGPRAATLSPHPPPPADTLRAAHRGSRSATPGSRGRLRIAARSRVWRARSRFRGSNSAADALSTQALRRAARRRHGPPRAAGRQAAASDSGP